jgi:hypothetical protein
MGPMLLLFGLSVVFMAIAFLIRRPWTIAVPFVAWLGLYGLGAWGIVTGETSLSAALFAGVLGALFAVAGLVLGSRQARSRSKT